LIKLVVHVNCHTYLINIKGGKYKLI